MGSRHRYADLVVHKEMVGMCRQRGGIRLERIAKWSLIVAACFILLVLTGCGDTEADASRGESATDVNTAAAVVDSTSKSNALLMGQARDSSTPEGAREVASLAEAEEAAKCPMLVPTDTLGQDRDGIRILEHGAVLLEYEGFHVLEEPFDDAERAQGSVDEAIGGVGFDDRFMRRVTIRGNSGIAWDPVDIVEPEYDSAGGVKRPGVTVPFGGVLWREGSNVYRVLGDSMSSMQLEEVAASMRPYAE